LTRNICKTEIEDRAATLSYQTEIRTQSCVWLIRQYVALVRKMSGTAACLPR